MLARQAAAPNSPQWFNTGLQLGVRHHRPAAGPLVRRARRRRAEAVHERLRAPCPARLLHPVRRRRPRQRGRHHGPVGARGPRVQVRLRHRLQLLRHPRRERAPLGRRPLLRPDELPQDRRPRRGRDQVGRHHAPRGEDGDARPRPSRHPALRALEGRRGDQGGRPRGRLADALRAPQQRRHGHRRGRRRGRRAVRRADQPGAARRPSAARARPACPTSPSSVRSTSPARASPSCTSTSTTPTGRARPTTPSRARTRTTRCASRPTSCAPSRATTTGTCIDRTERAHALVEGRPARPSSTLRARELWDDIAETRVALRRPGPAVPRHHQRVAHVPGRRRHPRLEPVRRVRLPRRHRLQPGVAEPARVRDAPTASTSSCSATASGCGRSCSRSRS